MKIKNYILFVFIVVCFKTYCQTIFINSITTSRQPTGDCGYTLDGGIMTPGATPKLLNLNNFGTGGIYPKNISIFNGYGTTGSLTQVYSVPLNNIFFYGNFNLLDSSTKQFTSAEVDSLYNWSKRGGKLIITSSPTTPAWSTPTLWSKWGFSMKYSLPSFFVPDSAGNKTDIFSGPFGSVKIANQGAGDQGFFDTLPSNSIIFANDTNGKPTIFMDCNTLDLVVGDVDGYTYFGGISSGPLINNIQDEFWANTIVFMDRLQPLPIIADTSNILFLNSAYNSYQWYINSIQIPGGVNPNYTVNGNGNYYVEVTVNGGCKVKSNTISVNDAGINIVANLDKIDIFPNPVIEKLTIETPQKSTIEILNIQGQLLKSIAANEGKTNIDVSAFPSGVYIVEMKTEKGVAVRKFVKE